MLTHHTDGRHKKENAVSKSGKMTYFSLISDSFSNHFYSLTLRTRLEIIVRLDMNEKIIVLFFNTRNRKFF